MTINVTLELYHPDEMDAFADFAKAMAKAKRERPKDKLMFGLESMVGGIDREAPSGWRRIDRDSTIPVSEEAGEILAEEAGKIAAEEALFASGEKQPGRARGKPAPGRARRTKEEIAEDEAADKADAVRAQAATEAGTQAESADDVKSAISTGDERVGPEDSAEDAAQDAADEAAETAADKTGLTLDDLRKAAGEYQKKFGMAAAVADIPGIIGGPIVEVPAEGIADAIAKIEAATKNKTPAETRQTFVVPEGHQAVKDAEGRATGAVEPLATKDQLVAALKRYAKKFDGQDTDMNAMPATMEDGAKIFTLLFGEGVTKLSQVPADGYGRAIAGIDEAIQKNPFKR